MDDLKNRPSIEDSDPLVVAVSRLGDAARAARRPGLLVFSLPINSTAEIVVTRSRFMADYGSICQLQSVDCGVAAGTTFAPTADVLAAIGKADPAEALDRLFKVWMAKGRG